MTGTYIWDAETDCRSIDLTQCGPRRYVAAKDFTVLLSVGYDLDANRFDLYGDPEIWEPILDILSQDQPDATFQLREAPPEGIKRVVGHNLMEFDRLVWNRLGWPEPEEWFDTLHACRIAGLPGRLDEVGALLFDERKDNAGSVALKRIISGKIKPTPAVLRPIGRYCVQDVYLGAKLYRATAPLVDMQGPEEAEFRAFDRAVNDGGIRVDIELANAIVRSESLQRMAAVAKVEEEGFDEKDIRSPKRMQAAFAEAGFDLPNCKRDTVVDMVDDPELPSDLRQLLYARLSVCRIAEKKVEKLLKWTCDDGYLRGAFAYYGASTGRFAGRGPQLQNLPSAKKVAKSRKMDTIIEELRSGVAVTPDEAGAAIRACLLPDLGDNIIVADYNAIEARVLAWMAEEEDILEMFRESDKPGGRDVYRNFGSKLLNIPFDEMTDTLRDTSKMIMLGCGYQMGEARFAVSAELSGIDLEALNLTPAGCVNAFRDARPRVAGTRTGRIWEGHVCREGGLWKAMEQAVAEALKHPGTVFPVTQCCSYHYDATQHILYCRLASGRTLVYRSIQVDGKTISYMTARRVRVQLYGGLLTERVCQSLARDILRHHALKLYRTYRIMLHVHDELGFSVPESGTQEACDRIRATMVTPPPWAPSLPLRTKPEVLKYYRK